MDKVKFQKAMEQASFHASIVLKGFTRTIYGALIAGLVGFAVYGFMSIGKESGYIAVADFVTSCATLAVALCNMYMMGRKRKGAKK